MNTIPVAMDIETRCNQPGCPGQKDMHACKHALSPFTSDLENCGFYWEMNGEERTRVVYSIDELQKFLLLYPNFRYIGCNFKWDINYLWHKGLKTIEEQWEDDIQLMAHWSLKKVPKDYLEAYEKTRKVLQKKLKQKFREGKRYSLKVLAPYFLSEAKPFWEVGDVSDEQYVIKDCLYTYKLWEHFKRELGGSALNKFYREKLIPWTRVLMHAERTGICIDLNLLEEKAQHANTQRKELIQKIDEQWGDVYEAFKCFQLDELKIHYDTLLANAISKLETPEESKLQALQARYRKLHEKALAKPDKIKAKPDLTSPKDMKWVLKDYFKYSIINAKGKESTGKGVLNLLIRTKDPKLQLYSDFRKYDKLATSFYPSYREKHQDGLIRCYFNPCGTVTGRLSSSNPNMQQVPGAIKELFTARPGYLLATYDMSAIEAVLIAYYTEDPVLLDIVFSGKDFHGTMVRDLYFPEIETAVEQVKANHPAERKLSKTLGYGLFYGAGKGRIHEVSVQQAFNFPKQRCKEIVYNLHDMFPQVFKFKEELDIRVRTEPIMNLFGRYHYFEDPSEIHMKNFNKLIQGSASDMVWNSAYKIAKIPDYRVLLLVHDEIVVEIPEDKADEAAIVIPKLMTDYKLPTHRGDIPLRTEGSIAKYWKK
jgi:DNA polymerase I-like protein with 3'-5' exonuclease and polymerase domains